MTGNGQNTGQTYPHKASSESFKAPSVISLKTVDK